MGLEEDLSAEIEKWTARLDVSLKNVRPADERGVKMMENIRAYRSDSQHFLKSGDRIRSFECLIWAWAIMEIGKELGHLEVGEVD